MVINILDRFWIGGIVKNNTLRWLDNSENSYTNWRKNVSVSDTLKGTKSRNKNTRYCVIHTENGWDYSGQCENNDKLPYKRHSSVFFLPCLIISLDFACLNL